MSTRANWSLYRHLGKQRMTSTNFSSHQHQAAAGNEGRRLSKVATSNFLTEHLRQETLSLKASNFCHDAWLGSRGEPYLAPNDVAVNDGIECENFLSGFRVHWIGKLVALVA